MARAFVYLDKPRTTSGTDLHHVATSLNIASCFRWSLPVIMSTPSCRKCIIFIQILSIEQSIDEQQIHSIVQCFISDSFRMSIVVASSRFEIGKSMVFKRPQMPFLVLSSLVLKLQQRKQQRLLLPNSMAQVDRNVVVLSESEHTFLVKGRVVCRRRIYRIPSQRVPVGSGTSMTQCKFPTST